MVYRITERFRKTHFRLVAQMRDSARSAKQNIREGYRKDTAGEFGHSIKISAGSLSELEGDVDDCLEDGLITNEENTKLKDFALSQTDKDRSSRMIYVLGEVAENLKKYEVAADIYKDLVDMKPMATLASEGQFRLARCYEKLGRRSDAVREYRTFIRNFPYDRLVPEAQKRAGGMMDKPSVSPGT